MFPYGPHLRSTPPLLLPQGSAHLCPLVSGASPMGRGSPGGYQTCRTSSCFRKPDPFCPVPRSVHLFVLSFSVPTPSEAQFPIVSVFPPIVEQQGPFLYPVGNDNEMSTAGDVGCRTGWHTPPEKRPGGVGLEQKLTSPRRTEWGEKVEMGSPSILQASRL